MIHVGDDARHRQVSLLGNLWAFFGALIGTAFLAFAMAFMAVVPSAVAATNYSHVGQFGGAGSANGQFANANMPQRIAVHEASGKLFVADRGNNRVQVFTPTENGAKFEFSIAIAGPVSLAVDSDNGDLYISNSAGIQKFNPDDQDDPGEYSADPDWVSPPIGNGVGEIGALQSPPSLALTSPSAGGLAVDPTDNSLLVADVGRNIVQRFNPQGGFVSSFDGCSPDLIPGVCLGTNRDAFSGLRDIAVTSTGDIIVADVSGNNARVDRLDRNGGLLATLSVNNDPVPNRYLTGQYANSVTVAVNQATDEVFVSSATSQNFFFVEQTHVYQFEDDQLVTPLTAPTNFQGHVFGIAARATIPGRLYVLAGALPKGSNFDANPVPHVQAFDAVTPATVTIDPVTGVTATTAEFSGTINPHNQQARWVFRYRRVGETDWQQTPATPEDIAPIEGDEPVSIMATGLAPNSDYEVQLAGRVGAIESETETVDFHTLPAAPDIEADASFISDTAVRLNGTIHPHSANVSYYFEWGSDNSYGEKLPVPNGSVLAAIEPVTVSVDFDGLEPSTTYHFRLVAENEFDQETVGSDQTFETLAASRSGLGAPRAYELIARLPTGGYGTWSGRAFSSPDGNQATFQNALTEPVPPHVDVEPNRNMLATRGDDGWGSIPIDIADNTIFEMGGETRISRAFPRSVFRSESAIDPDDHNHAWDLYLVTPGEEPKWITRSMLVEPGEPQTDGVDNPGLPTRSAMSDSGETVAFATRRRLVEEDPFTSGAPVRLYKWQDGDLILLSIRPDDSVANEFVTIHRVSADGSRVAWGTAEDVFGNGPQTYVQVDGEAVVDAGDGRFVGASRDLSRVFVLDDALYLVDVNAGTRREVAEGAQVREVLPGSEDAGVVYVVSPEVLDSARSPLGMRPVTGADNLYRVDIGSGSGDDRLSFVAASTAGSLSAGTASTNPDASVLAFVSPTAITGSPTGSSAQMFVYDVVANSLACASCPADGSVPAAGEINAQVTRAGNDTQTGWYNLNGGQDRRYVMPDGTVFFSTKTPLLPEDENEDRDVYEYRGGDLRLISSGGWNDGPSTFEDANVDGTTVLITSSVTLEPRDNEPGVRKVYAARVGGGFPVADLPNPACAGDDCQGPPPPQPARPPLGSAALSGDGNVESAARQVPRTSVRVARLRTPAGAIARLRVRVPAAGRVAVSGRHVRGAARRAPRAGALTLRVALKPRIRRVLRTRNRLRIPVRVLYRSADGQSASRSLRVIFRRPQTRQVRNSRGGR